VGVSPSDDQIYRITFDGSVTDEPGFVAFGGQADQVSAALKERYSDDMSLSEAFAAALAALGAPGNGGEATEFAAAQLEVAILDRARDHRTFRRIRAARLEELLAEARPAPAAEPADEPAAESSGSAPSGSAPSGTAPSGSAPSGTSPGSSTPPSSTGPSSPSSPSDTEPPTGPAPGGSDRGTGLDGGSPL
jgi:proteasome alpha subunit